MDETRLVEATGDVARLCAHATSTCIERMRAARFRRSSEALRVMAAGETSRERPRSMTRGWWREEREG